jgi:Rrf2 family transcriptional regulator, iron-sulfur cluster assembly transcription factor
MVRLSKKSILALIAILDLASNDRDGLVRDRDISRRQGFPERYLESLLQRFVHAGILQSVRGPHGGYRLARPTNEIRLGQIDALIAQTEPSNGIAEHAPASRLGREIVVPLIADLQRIWDKMLNEYTVSALLSR